MVLVAENLFCWLKQLKVGRANKYLSQSLIKKWIVPTKTHTYHREGALWSYSCWIYNYLCNQYLAHSANRVHGEIYSIQNYVILKVCQWLTTGRWFSPSTPVSSTNKTDRHDITDILLSVALNTIAHFVCNLSRFLYQYSSNTDHGKE